MHSALLKLSAVNISQLALAFSHDACRSLSTAEDALRHATDLQKDGLRVCYEEFMTVLKANLIEPNAPKLAQQAIAAPQSPARGACSVHQDALLTSKHAL